MGEWHPQCHARQAFCVFSAMGDSLVHKTQNEKRVGLMKSQSGYGTLWTEHPRSYKATEKREWKTLGRLALWLCYPQAKATYQKKTVYHGFASKIDTQCRESSDKTTQQSEVQPQIKEVPVENQIQTTAVKPE